MRFVPRNRRRQRGTAALIITLSLLLAMALVTAFANRNLVLEQRASANQYRSTQAFEAAEAGLEWATAQLNAPQRIGADCRPSGDPDAASFRSRYLDIARRTGVLTPATWLQSGRPAALEPSCMRTGDHWSCSCPADGAPSPPAPSGSTPASAFTVRFLPADRPGVVRLAAQGCVSRTGQCLPAAGDRPDASAAIEIELGLLVALGTAPAATVTVRGDFDAGSASLGLHNPDPATGLAVDAGGAIRADQARLTPPAGAPTTGLLAAHDAALAALDADRLFASHFGVDRAAWASQPAVTRIACALDCAAALAAAVDAAPDGALIQVDGDLPLAGPLTLGTAQRPVAIVVSGAARLDGAIGLTGVLYAASIAWNHPSGPAYVRGALLSEAGYEGDGTPELFYDTEVLDALGRTQGSFARVHGSWRDF